MKKQSCARTHRTRHRTRGAAMVEAVAILPVFILLFVGIFFIRDEMVKNQELDTKARSCAWQYSRNACSRLRHDPDGCNELVEKGRSAPEGIDPVTRIKEAFSNVQSAGSSSSSNFVKDTATEIIGRFLDKFFDKAAVATTTGTVKRPPLFGGGTVRIEGHYRLACDLEKSDPMDIARNIWSLRER